MTIGLGGMVAYDAGLHPVAGLEKISSLLTTKAVID